MELRTWTYTCTSMHWQSVHFYRQRIPEPRDKNDMEKTGDLLISAVQPLVAPYGTTANLIVMKHEGKWLKGSIYKWSNLHGFNPFGKSVLMSYMCLYIYIFMAIHVYTYKYIYIIYDIRIIFAPTEHQLSSTTGSGNLVGSCVIYFDAGVERSEYKNAQHQTVQRGVNQAFCCVCFKYLGDSHFTNLQIPQNQLVLGGMMDPLNDLFVGMKSCVMVKFTKDQGTHGVQNQVVLAGFGHLKASCSLAHDALSRVIS